MGKHFLTYLLLGILVLGSGCTKPIDFNQSNDFVITPVMESSLIYINQNTSDFLDGDDNIISLVDVVEVNFFKDAFIVDNVEKADFEFEITNSINSDFSITIGFYDERDVVQHSIEISVIAATNNSEITSFYIEEFRDATLRALKNTSEMKFTLEMLPNIPIDQITTGTIGLKSKAVFYFNIDTNL